MRPVFFIVLAMLVASSCQKGVDMPETQYPTDTLPDAPAEELSPDNGGLLKRQVWKIDRFDDSVFANYVYDEEYRLIELNQHFAAFTEPGEDDYIYRLRFSYGDNGMVNKMIRAYRPFDGIDIAYSNTEIDVFHDASTSRYTYGIKSHMIEFEGSSKDSIAYVYDSQGRISGSTSVDLDHGFVHNHIYTYDDNDNIIRVQRFYGDVIKDDLTYDLHYQYDDKINPDIFGAMALLMPDDGISFSVGKNNYLSAKDKKNQIGVSDRSFTYNTYNKPAEATLGDDPGETTIKYLYAR